MTARLLGGVGRFFITTGLVVLLFVGYQLWGTGLQEASAQNSLGDDFDSLLEEASLETPINPTTTTVASVETTEAPATTTTTTTTIPAAGGTIPVDDEALAEALFREGGEAVARIEIPDIEVSKVVVEGVHCLLYTYVSPGDATRSPTVCSYQERNYSAKAGNLSQLYYLNVEPECCL